MGQTHTGPAPFDYLYLPVCSGSTDSGAGSGSGAGCEQAARVASASMVTWAVVRMLFSSMTRCVSRQNKQSFAQWHTGRRTRRGNLLAPRQGWKGRAGPARPDMPAPSDYLYLPVSVGSTVTAGSST